LTISTSIGVEDGTLASGCTCAVQSAVCVAVFDRNNVDFVTEEAECSAAFVGRKHRYRARSSSDCVLTVGSRDHNINRSCGDIAGDSGSGEGEMAILYS